MADEEPPLIDVPELEQPWGLLFEVAEATPANSWILVGGLMVHVHALSARVDAQRPTRDVDLLLDIGVAQIGEVAGPLQALGFRPHDGAPLHRFTRGSDVIDVMVARSTRARWGRRPVFAAPGAAQALARRRACLLQGEHRTAEILIPDPLGAVVVKAAAFRADHRDRGRHLEDVAVLLASSGGRRRLAPERLSRTDKQHLRPAMDELVDAEHAAWSVLAPDDRIIGRRALAALTEAF